MSALLIAWEYQGFSKAVISDQMSQEAQPCSFILFKWGT